MKNKMIKTLTQLDENKDTAIVLTVKDDNASAYVLGDDEDILDLSIAFLVSSLPDEMLTYALAVIAKEKPVVFQSAIDLNNQK